MNAHDVVIDVHGLTKKFDGRAVVRNLSMQVKRGTIYGFLGPNGSGKTTTIRMLCGLLTPDAGTGTCLGYDIRTDTDKIKRHVGSMTQRFSLYQDLSVRENLEFIGRVYGIDQPVAAARGAIERLGLTGRGGELAGRIFGGGRQAGRWSGLVLRGGRSSSRPNSRAGGSSDWHLAPARCRARNCCSSTSPPPGSIRRQDGSFGTRFTHWRPTD